MNRNRRPTCQGWTVIVLCAAVLALGGCGRKGPLDLPPNASQAAQAADIEAEETARPGVFGPSYATEAQPSAPKGRKKSFVLDPLLD